MQAEQTECLLRKRTPDILTWQFQKYAGRAGRAESSVRAGKVPMEGGNPGIFTWRFQKYAGRAGRAEHVVGAGRVPIEKTNLVF